MPCWYFDKVDLKNTPSFRDNLDPETEARYRREGSRFLMELGINMGLRYDTMATGVVFYHRFYMFHSFNEFPRYVMATCCLFLAGKVEETPKKCKDIVKAAKQWLESKNLKKHVDSFGEDPIKEIMTYERILLQTIKFDLQVDHPYGYLLKYAKTLKGNQEQIRAMVQMAWTFINDSYSTTLCLQWEPEIIAIALMYLTSKLNKLEITDWIARKESQLKQNWWDQFVEGLRIDILEDICHQILDLYTTQQQQNQQPQVSTQQTNKATSPTSTPNKTTSNPNIRKRPNSPVQSSSTVAGYSSRVAQLQDTTSPTSAKLPRTINNSVSNENFNNTTLNSTGAPSSIPTAPPSVYHQSYSNMSNQLIYNGKNSSYYNQHQHSYQNQTMDVYNQSNYSNIYHAPPPPPPSSSSSSSLQTPVQPPSTSSASHSHSIYSNGGNLVVGAPQQGAPVVTGHPYQNYYAQQSLPPPPPPPTSSSQNSQPYMLNNIPPLYSSHHHHHHHHHQQQQQHHHQQQHQNPSNLISPVSASAPNTYQNHRQHSQQMFNVSNDNLSHYNTGQGVGNSYSIYNTNMHAYNNGITKDQSQMLIEQQRIGKQQQYGLQPGVPSSSSSSTNQGSIRSSALKTINFTDRQPI